MLIDRAGQNYAFTRPRYSRAPTTREIQYINRVTCQLLRRGEKRLTRETVLFQRRAEGIGWLDILPRNMHIT